MELFNEGLIQLTQCYHCFAWTHKRNACPKRGDPVICSHCSQTGHPYTECPNDLRCTNCDGAHSATTRSCPAHTQAQNIVIERMKMTFQQNNSLATPTHNQANQSFSPDLIKIAEESQNEQEFISNLFTTCKAASPTSSPIIQPPNFVAEPVESVVTQIQSTNTSLESQDTVIDNLNTTQELPLFPTVYDCQLKCCQSGLKLIEDKSEPPPF